MIIELSEDQLERAYDSVEDVLGCALVEAEEVNIVTLIYSLMVANEHLISTLTSSDPGAIDALQEELSMDMVSFHESMSL